MDVTSGGQGRRFLDPPPWPLAGLGDRAAPSSAPGRRFGGRLRMDSAEMARAGFFVMRRVSDDDVAAVGSGGLTASRQTPSARGKCFGAGPTRLKDSTFHGQSQAACGEGYP